MCNEVTTASLHMPSKSILTYRNLRYVQWDTDSACKYILNNFNLWHPIVLFGNSVHEVDNSQNTAKFYFIYYVERHVSA
jgi:hypothetical protein